LFSPKLMHAVLNCNYSVFLCFAEAALMVPETVIVATDEENHADSKSEGIIELRFKILVA